MNTENNKIIAEFMGLSYCEKYQFEGWYKNHEHNERICDFDGLKYHSDWNWLMEVVEKIESLNHKNNEEHFQLVSFIHHWLRRKHKELTKIQAVYSACLEFIKWYNEQII